MDVNEVAVADLVVAVVQAVDPLVERAQQAARVDLTLEVEVEALGLGADLDEGEAAPEGTRTSPLPTASCPPSPTPSWCARSAMPR